MVPFGQAGAVTYGPNVNAAAILLGSAGNVPVERTAMLMAALLGSPVSTGFVARAHERFAERLQAAGFDDAMSSALTREPVLCGDETPVNVARKDSDEHGTPVPETALTLAGSVADRVAKALGAKPGDLEPALDRWASELHLESRLLPGRIDLAVLEVLERGVGATLERVAADPPREGWPA